jgi:predicted secreted protein
LADANLQITNDTTATVQITSGAQAGSWALQITGAGGTSTREGTGGNVFTVAP